VLQTEQRESLLLRGSQREGSRATGNPDELASHRVQLWGLVLKPHLEPLQLRQDLSHRSVVRRMDLDPIHHFFVKVRVALPDGIVPPWIILVEIVQRSIHIDAARKALRILRRHVSLVSSAQRLQSTTKRILDFGSVFDGLFEFHRCRLPSGIGDRPRHRGVRAAAELGQSSPASFAKLSSAVEDPTRICR
jgi:hypothetical protein